MFGANKKYNIFYINFHKIKEEIQTQKTSWGNLKSFLAKHIKKLVDEDENMKSRKAVFRDDIIQATDKVLKGEPGESKSKLISFIEKIQKNYSANLRDNNCEVEFGLPDYEDIFLQMIFKIGLNGKADKLVPIDHFGDGYISMFVMAVIQAIAEEKTDDKCLFLFEEPESFLHENHQEYFYKMVLCELAQKGHQVIYTTHSDKMVDITKPDSLIRLKFDGEQTIKTFPAGLEQNPLEKPEDQVIIKQYNQYIKSIEPNLNKILFSEKVILVEGPNDLLVYYYLIKLRANDKADKKVNLMSETAERKQKWAETYLNFNNIAIIPHHGKATAYILADLCNYLGVDYFLINDWDFEKSELDIEKISKFKTQEKLNEDFIYKEQTNSNKKGMITTNWKLIKSAKNNQIHFNIKKLETIIGYGSDDKNPLKIWETIESKFPSSDKIGIDIFPETLDKFVFPVLEEQIDMPF
jgi:predicted ATP-dependent endonuclease of OLD family